MRRSLLLLSLSSLAISSVAISSVASAGPVAVENARPGSTGWVVTRFGNAQGEGVIDLYPASWSIARGQSINLKVRSTGSYTLKLYRLGWYGGDGARQLAVVSGRPADPQPYPTSTDPATGYRAAGWRVTDTFTTDAGFAPGLYVVRAEHASGAQAMTFVVVRDDGLSPRMPILVSVTTATHQAYNAWPGASRGGKSLYGFNSSSAKPTDSVSNQAVKVSFDRPYLVGGGTADVLRYEYPFLRWAERNGYDVAWCTDEDLARDPGLVRGRRVFAISGHWEYLSKPAYDAVSAARDGGTHLLIMSGDTLPWQVRLEGGGIVQVGYKEGWDKDPEHLAGVAAAEAGKIEEAKKHFAVVTRGWKRLGYYPSYGIDLRRPAMGFLGVQSAGAMGPNGPWGDLRVAAPEHWLFEGTGLKKGDVIPRVMGYEYDNLTDVDGDYSAFVPPGRVKLGGNIHPRTGEEVGGAAYHRVASGAEIVALGAVNFAYALDGFASPWTSENDHAKRMIHNALRRWTDGAPLPSLAELPAGETESDAGAMPDTAVPDVLDTSVVEDTGPGDTSVVDTSVVDTSVVDTSVVDTAASDDEPVDTAEPSAPDAEGAVDDTGVLDDVPVATEDTGLAPTTEPPGGLQSIDRIPSAGPPDAALAVNEVRIPPRVELEGDRVDDDVGSCGVPARRTGSAGAVFASLAAALWLRRRINARGRSS